MRWDEAQGVLDDAVRAGAFPGGVAVAGDRAQVVWTRAVGRLAREPKPGEPVSPDTIYDVASLTKPTVTTALVMRLVEAGRLALDTPAAAYVPELLPPRDVITVRHLLTHSAGLAAWRPFYEKAPLAREDLLRLAALEPLEAEPGARSVYSDLGYIILGFVVERAAGERLDVLARRAVFEPLGMTSARFVDLTAPREPFPAPVAPTEICPRRGLLVGEVHDDNCHAGGGVLGHAGLFVSAPDLARFAAAMCRSFAGEHVPGGFPPELVRTFFTPSGVPGSTWRLGWDGPAETGSSLGSRWPRSAVGHLGYTGCSMWLDPPRGRFAILLSNRVHPSRADERIKEVRPRFYDAVWCALEASPAGG